MSKLLEKLTARQLLEYLSVNKLPARQSAYRTFRSTETAIAGLLCDNDILSALDTRYIAVIALLDLSAAFDTVDHTILLQRLQTPFGLCHCVVLVLFVPGSASAARVLPWHAVSNIRHPVWRALGVRTRPTPVRTVHGWYCQHYRVPVCRRHTSIRLQLNAAKTEFMWFVPPRRRYQLPSDHLTVGPVQVKPAASVHDLCIYLDSDLSMRLHICACFGVPRLIRSIRRSLPRESALTLISSLVMSKLDYCNVAFAGLSRCELDRLQSVINAAACLTVEAQRHDHITPLLTDLHWLRFPQRIQHKLCVVVFNCVHGFAPRYLLEVIRPVANVEPRRRLRSASSADLTVPATRRSALGDSAFDVAGPCTWNTLPDAIRRCSSPDFKRSLKTHLYTQSYF